LEKNTIIELKERLFHIIPIENIDYNKLYEEILSFFSETEENYLIRRHKELQNDGYKNNEIYPMLSEEITQRLFKGNKLTDRQIKRIIYKEK